MQVIRLYHSDAKRLFLTKCLCATWRGYHICFRDWSVTIIPSAFSLHAHTCDEWDKYLHRLISFSRWSRRKREEENVAIYPTTWLFVQHVCSANEYDVFAIRTFAGERVRYSYAICLCVNNLFPTRNENGANILFFALCVCKHISRRVRVLYFSARFVDCREILFCVRVI